VGHLILAEIILDWKFFVLVVCVVVLLLPPAKREIPELFG
jgi:hypothetical protein